MYSINFKWDEPNRRNTPPLHIAKHGARFSTLTGVHWLDNNFFIVNHRSGLRMALFDKRKNNAPISITDLLHLTDDIAAKKINEDTWEIAVSGCWDCEFSLFKLNIKTHTFEFIYTRAHKNKTFCHGVAYDDYGRLWLALHTGEYPRIEAVDKDVWKLPKPWGARDICFDIDNHKAFAVAVSSNPKLTSYEQAKVSVWEYQLNEPKRIFFKKKWKKIIEINNLHSDACAIYKGRIWLPDQLNDRVLAISLDNYNITTVSNLDFDFPHGISVSEDGMVAVTNYGSSAVILFDANNVIL